MATWRKVYRMVCAIVAPNRDNVSTGSHRPMFHQTLLNQLHCSVRTNMFCDLSTVTNFLIRRFSVCCHSDVEKPVQLRIAIGADVFAVCPRPIGGIANCATQLAQQFAPGLLKSPTSCP